MQVSIAKSILFIHGCGLITVSQLAINSPTTVPLKNNVAFACIPTLAQSFSIIRITPLTCGSLCQFEHFSVLCLKGVTIERRACEWFILHKLPQVVRSTQNNTQSLENKWVQCCPRAVPCHWHNCILYNEKVYYHYTTYVVFTHHFKVNL